MTDAEFQLDRLLNRWVVTADLVADTGLHIGSGEEAGSVDSGIVQDASDRPFIPGSSLKGVLRSEAERIAHALGLRACGLYSVGSDCLTADKGAADSYREMTRRSGPDLECLTTHLCDACRLFGSQFIASRVFVDDLPLSQDYHATIERRDGVGIDRDSGTAVDGVKYDFQVTPATTRFKLRITAENLSIADRALLSFVLLELADGSYGIGGIRSRGLGNCHLEDLTITDRRLGSPEDVIAYLDGTGAQPRIGQAARAFLVECVKEGCNSVKAAR